MNQIARHKLSLRELWKYGFASGMLLGLVCLIPIIGGWDKYLQQYREHHDEYILHPGWRIFTSLFICVIIGVMMCWIIHRFASTGKTNHDGYRKAIIFFTGGLLTTIAIQLASRDALVFSARLMQEGKGGPLGEPSFETIGNFLAAGVISVDTYILFRNFYTKLSFRSNYFSTLVKAVLAYGAVFLLWYSLTHGQPVEESWGLTPYIFDGSFPHPARIVLLPLMISILFIVYFFGIRAEIRKINRSEFDVAISYTRADAAFVNKLYHKLITKNIRVYKYDEYSHEVIGKVIIDYIICVFRDRSKYGLIIVSQSYISSKYGSAELECLKNKNLEHRDIILPIILDGTRLSELNLPDDLAYIDARQEKIDKIVDVIVLKVKSSF